MLSVEDRRFFEHGGVGHGRTLYNEQVKIPFVIKAPLIEPGEHTERVQLIDIYPTICEYVDLDVPEQVEGQSFAYLFEDGSISRQETAYSEYERHAGDS